MLHGIQLKTNIHTVTEDSSVLPKAGTVVVTVAVLSFLLFLACTTARAQAPAGPNRPVGVPDGYVITPSGYFHPSCVRQLKEGETLLEDGRVLQHADGTTESVPACAYPRYTARGEIVGAEPLAIKHSYIERAEATTSTSYGGLTVTWTVPPAPATNDGQIVYLFPGFDDINDIVSILQPVLGWNADFAGAWGVASWNCCPNGITTESRPVSVSPGDEIMGTIQDTCSAGTVSCPTWNVATVDVTQGTSTTLPNTPSEGQTFNWAFAGALEVWNLVQCSDYPPNGALTFSDVALYDYNFDLISNPGWSFENEASGLTPQCGYTGKVGATQVTLDYSPVITLASFSGYDGDGAFPEGGLVQATNGDLYGTTLEGGAKTGCGGGCGTVFKITPSGTLTTLYSFCSQSGCPDGFYPGAGLVQATNGDLYGTTEYGGANGYGTVFRIAPSGTLTTLYSFCSQSGCTDGSNPYAGLVQAANGDLYGTTEAGGANVVGGTVFKITPGGALTTLYSFCSQSGCTDGIGPVAALVQATNGDLYGTTAEGGANPGPSGIGGGTVFKITPSGALTTLYSFCSQGGCTDGAFPEGGLVQATKGDLYGTTEAGGASASCSGGCGTVFKISPSGALTTLYSFCSQSGCTDGYVPTGLVQATNGYLYGTAGEGGANGYGTVFRIAPTGALTTLYSFCPQSGCTDSAGPDATLVQATNGYLYGTAGGGAYGNGTVFSVFVDSGPFVETLPTSGKVGAAVKILGTNLTGATSVSFNGTGAVFEVVSSSEITTTVPTGATTGTVQVVTPNGTLSSNVPFRVP
jgi:uncharacterized repeat protein (TIGR03803 family)